MSRKIWTKEDVLARLAQTKSQPTMQAQSVLQSIKGVAKPSDTSNKESVHQEPIDDGAAELEWAYRSAAAMLSSFSPADLKPVGDFASDDGLSVAALLDDSTSIYAESDLGLRWQLRDGPRKRALQRLGTRQALQLALVANEPRPNDALQQIFERTINQEPLPLEEQNLEQLTATLRVVGWLDGVVGPLPEATEVQEAYTWAELLEPFRYLVGDHFRGRQAELDTLRTFVMRPNGVSAGATTSMRTGSMRTGTTRLYDPSKRPGADSNMLLVHGPGGMGKSTLLSKFLLDIIGGAHSNGRSNDRAVETPFVYIDFDRPSILPEEPLTLLSEAVRQFGVQFPALRVEAHALRNQWRDLLATSQEPSNLAFTKGGSRSNATRAIGTAYEQRTVAQTIQNRAPYLDQFIAFWQSMQAQLQQKGVAEIRLVLVLDTFEEVQYLSQDFVEELLTFAYTLVDQIPELRVIVSGRAPVEDRPATGTRSFSHSFTQRPMQELILGELDHDAAIGFLAAHGIGDEQIAQRTFEQVGGNPLSLRLAIDLLSRGASRGESGGVSDLEDARTATLQIDQGLIQGQLYTRILNHIHSDDVRQLAHPGLVLRRVTPELIKEVLAETCHVAVPTIERARELFNAMMNEVALVRIESDGSLHHRPDVRRIMLKSLQRDEPLRVYEIHKKAVEFYAALDGPMNRAEEIYHRLLRGSRFTTIDGRWLEGVEPFLRNAIEDLPPHKRQYLAARLGVTSAEFNWDQAGIEEWERYAKSRVIDLTSLGQPEHALALLSERSERTVESPLYRLEAQILAGEERWLEAQQVAKAGIYAASQAKDDEKLLDLLIVAANANEQLGEYAQALEMLDAAEALDVELREPDASLLRLEIMTQRLRLMRIDPDSEQSGIDGMKDDAYALYEKVGNDRGFQAFGRIPLLRDLAVEIGLEHTSILRVALAYIDDAELQPKHRDLIDQKVAYQDWEKSIGKDWKLIQAALPEMPLKNSAERL